MINTQVECVDPKFFLCKILKTEITTVSITMHF